MKINAPTDVGLTVLAVAMYTALYVDPWLAAAAAQSIADEWRRPSPSCRTATCGP